MKDFFIDKLAYNFYANKQVIALVYGNSSVYKTQIASLYSHVLNAQQIWNERILQKENTVGVWDIIELSNIDNVNQRISNESVAIVETIKLDAEISYKNSKGLTFKNTIEGILYHSINHATYHRGQIITLLKQQGTPVISTDYIFYKR